MDDLLLFSTAKKSHMAKLEDMLQALPKKWIENNTQEMSTF